ncbi:MAG: hypothetical protein ACI4JC_01115 [Faecalibacterium sp.]
MSKRELMQQKMNRQQAILASARKAGRDMTDEETREFNSLQDEIENLRPESEAEEKAAREAEIQAARTAERDRVTSITNICRSFDIDPQGYITGGQTVDQVREAIMNDMIKNGSPARTGIRVTEDEQDKFRAAAADGLMIRSGHSPAQPADGARQFSGMSLRDIGIECLSRETGKSANEYLRKDNDYLYDELARAFHNPSAAFPAIMDQAINKSIVHMYSHVPTTFEKITRKGTLRDFKRTDGHNYLIGGVGELLLVPENGELKADTHQEATLPQRKLETYGRQFSMSRQAFINDDIGFLSEVPGLYAAKSKKQINKAVYSILYNNGTIYDGKTFFHDSHKNLMSVGSAPSGAAIQSMIQRLQIQEDQFGEAINLTPATLVVPVGYGFTLQTIFGSPTIQTTENTQAVNPLYNYRHPISIVEDATLNLLAGSGACPWFLGAGREETAGIQVDYLNGQETPTFRRSETTGQLGFVWDIWLDWGITVMDYRAFVKNPGVVLPTL